MARLSTEERQKLIIDEAIKIIHNSGYNSLSIRELAQRVGISEPAIYRHFLNKEDIVLGILSRFNEFDQKLFNEVKNYDNPIDQIKSFVKFHFEFLNKTPEMTSIIFAEDIFSQNDFLKEKMLAIIMKRKKLMKSIIDEAKTKNQILNLETDELLTVILGFIRLVVLEWRMGNFSFSLSDRGSQTVKTIEKLLTK